MEVVLDNLTQAENIIEDILPLKEILERKLNLSRQLGQGKSIVLTWNKVMRICLIASLNLPDKRSIERLNEVQLNKSSQRIQPSFFTKDNKRFAFLRSAETALIRIVMLIGATTVLSPVLSHKKYIADLIT